MSQSGKIYHVYVEVRDGDGLDSLMLQPGPDVLPLTQRGAPHQAHSPAVSPGMLHKGGGGSNQSLSSNKSSSRHSVSFHLGHSGAEEHQQLHCGGPHRQSLPYDGVAHLLSSLHASGGHNGVLMRARSMESEPPYGGRESLGTGRYTAPPTPCTGRRPYGGAAGRDGEGRRSVVTFSYIEKGCVQAADGHHGFSPYHSEAESEPEPEPQNPFNRALEEEAELSASLARKRNSDPVQFSSWESLGGGPGSRLTASQRHALNLRRATLDSIAREATSRALEEFGSPQIRRRLEAQNQNQHGTQMQESPRCRSLGGSPILPRGTSTLPANTHLADLERNHLLAFGLPRSPATDHLSSHTKHSYYTLSHSRPHSYGTATQKQWHAEDKRQWYSADDSPRLPYKYGPALPSCRPTAIQHEIPAMTVTKAPASQPKPNHQHHASDSPRSSHRVNFNLNASKQGKAAVSPSASPELARKLAEEATKLSTIFMERRSPSPVPSSGEETNRSDSPRSGSLSRESQIYASHSDVSLPLHDFHWGSERESVKSSAPQSGHSSPLTAFRSGASPSPAPPRLHRPETSPSPVRDPRLDMGDLSGQASPTPHRHRPPQFTGGDGWSPGPERRLQQVTRYDQQPRGSPESLCRGYADPGAHPAETPVSWAAQLQRWREERLAREMEKCDQPYNGSLMAALLNSAREDDNRRKMDATDAERASGGGVGGVGGVGGGGVCDSGDSASKSSSGVTGSIGDSLTPERDSLSTESSSPASRRSSDSPNTNSAAAVQSERLSRLGSTLRSQKIARAKWEFLFGIPSYNQHGTRDTPAASTVPSSGQSRKPPTSTTTSPASSLPRKPQRSRRVPGPQKDALPQQQQQALSHHEVQRVEVELVGPSPSSASPSVRQATSPSSSPRTGIIRRTVKYSETDLDAVPMRCYRETDLDELMQAQEGEGQGEGQGQGEGGKRTGANGVSAFGGEGRSSGRRRGRGGEVERVVEEEGVVSWASVRMLGDRKRQASATPHQEDGQVLNRLLKGAPDNHSDNRSTLQSPVAVGNPRRISAEGLDSFSRHFESIMESHRAKGTSYSSLDSEDMTSSSPPVFTFDLPTLTPEIQSQICASARQISDLSFAPLVRAEGLSLSDRTGGSDPTLAPFKEGEELDSTSEDDTTAGSGTTDGSTSEGNPDSPLGAVLRLGFGVSVCLCPVFGSAPHPCRSRTWFLLHIPLPVQPPYQIWSGARHAWFLCNIY
ncbi:hypothetical protein ACEWY4_020716 [Coilia grayii]|uniref:Uncharacterized protein n=1 Tax=Coilia grayii TaxID=363190 RepID=A0ABD1J6X3_9TELE